MQKSSPRTISGDDVISELTRNLDVGAFKVRYTILVPCVFNVYLHEQDEEVIRPIAEFVRKEAKQALSEHLAKLDKRPRSMFGKVLKHQGGRPAEHKILDPDWTIEFHRDEEERLCPGEIEIYSNLGTGPRAELGAGAMTTFITRSKSEDLGISASASQVQPGSDRPTYALLRYRDSDGEKAFAMNREDIVVGRGGKAVWVDLQLQGPPDVSREHCRIRHDAATGLFFIKDLSQYGTAVSGARIPSSVERLANGDKVDRNVEFPLPMQASILLADVFELRFEAKLPG